jgi:16S rRNA (guanine527-N7)-methyltransferase
VAQSVATAIGLTNLSVRHCRVEDEKGLFDFVVSRAVMPLSDLVQLCRKNISTDQRNALPNGIICLKGGELHEELKSFKHMVSEMDLSKHFKEDYFNTKKVVYLPVNQTKSR